MSDAIVLVLNKYFARCGSLFSLLRNEKIEESSGDDVVLFNGV
jgi:hypothetical protein